QAKGDFIGEIEPFAPGQTCTTTFTLGPGTYAMYCNLLEQAPGEPVNHFAKGMVTVFNVREAPAAARAFTPASPTRREPPGDDAATRGGDMAGPRRWRGVSPSVVPALAVVLLVAGCGSAPRPATRPGRPGDRGPGGAPRGGSARRRSRP